MKIILCEDVAHVGSAGEVKEISPGYARNFLFPRELALPATPSNLKKWESEKKVREVRLSQSLEAARTVAGQMEKISLDIAANAGREGHLFGSVTNQMIADALLEKGFSIDKKNIILESPIKSVGEYQVSVRLHAQVTVPFKVIISASQSVKHPAETPAEPSQESTPVEASHRNG